RPTERLAGWDDLLDQADLFRLAGVDADPGLHEPQGVSRPHGGGQAVRAAVEEGDAPTPVERPELRLLPGDAEVTPGRQLHPTGEAVAVDGGDGRLSRIERSEAHRPGVDRPRVTHQRVDPLEVGAGAERHTPGAGDDQDASLIVGAEFVDRSGQLPGRGRVDGVAGVRASQGEHRDRPGAFSLDRHFRSYRAVDSIDRSSYYEDRSREAT